MNPNPDLAAALPALEEAGLPPAARAATAGRLARGELMSVRAELRAALYAGVLLIVAGVSVLVRQNYERIGPRTIAVAIALAALACLAWVARRAPRFTWGRAPAGGLALDYILLLGALLVAADLAFVETRFAALGPSWPWHLLIVALLYAALGVRYDSRTLFSLALSSFAAWRGVAVGWRDAEQWLGEASAEVRRNAIGCGVLFLVAGFLMRRFDRKRHFEPVTVVLGWLLVLGSEASGMIERGWTWAIALFATGAGLAIYASWRRRFGLFALGVLAGYGGVSYLVVRAALDVMLGCAWFFFTSTLLVLALVVAQRRWFRGGTSS